MGLYALKDLGFFYSKKFYFFSKSFSGVTTIGAPELVNCRCQNQRKGGGMMRSSDIFADILYILSDCKIHSIQELADEVECSRRTVQRYLVSLSYRYPIQTSVGCGKKQGVYLDKAYIYQGKIRSKDELQIIHKALKLLQEFGCEEIDSKLLDQLIQEYTPPTNNEGEMCL